MDAVRTMIMLLFSHTLSPGRIAAPAAPENANNEQGAEVHADYNFMGGAEAKPNPYSKPIMHIVIIIYSSVHYCNAFVTTHNQSSFT